MGLLLTKCGGWKDMMRCEVFCIFRLMKFRQPDKNTPLNPLTPTMTASVVQGKVSLIMIKSNACSRRLYTRSHTPL